MSLNTSFMPYMVRILSPFIADEYFTIFGMSERLEPSILLFSLFSMNIATFYSHVLDCTI